MGRVWLLLGSSYKAEAQYRQAQEAYATAGRLLKSTSPQSKEYVTLLRENGSLYRELGDWGEAERLERTSLKLSEQHHNHAAIARACQGLSELSLDRGRLKDSEHYIQQAENESRLTNELDADDRSYLAQLQGWIALKQGNAADAISDYKRSIMLLTARYGETFALTGWGYILLASAYDQGGATEQAIDSGRKAMAILEHTVGKSDPRYASAEIRYSGILNKTGQAALAAHLKADGEAVLYQARPTQCAGCTIDVATFQESK